MILLYRVVVYLLFVLGWPILLAHPKLRQGVRQRLGWYPGRAAPWPSRPGKGPRFWLHGASAGDLLALLPIIQELRRSAPEAVLCVSAMTNSGQAMAEERLRALVDGFLYVPYDLPGATRRAMALVQPDVLVLEYTELWPNLIAAARARGARVAITNGRISERLLGRYRLFFALMGNPLTRVDLLLMREEVEAERALALGAPRERVRITGNTKFDNVAKGPGEQAVAALRRAFAVGAEPIWVCGSTHEGEERELIKVFLALRATAPELRLILAPRYVERAPKLAALARAEGLSVVLRSEAGESRAEVLIIDRIGELLAAYSLATLVFVGGSFVSRGGQNILEPAGQGKPVLFGPHMMNFRDSVEVLLGRGGIQVAGTEQLGRVARELLTRPEELARLGEMARSAVQKARGASARNAEALLALSRIC